MLSNFTDVQWHLWAISIEILASLIDTMYLNITYPNYSSNYEGNGLKIYTIQAHYSDVIMSAMTSQITGVVIVCLTVCSGTDQRNIKAPRHWLFWGDTTGHRWIPFTKGQWRGNCLHLMTSSWCKRQGCIYLALPRSHSTDDFSVEM